MATKYTKENQMARSTIVVIAVLNPVPKFHLCKSSEDSEVHNDNWDFFVPGSLFQAIEHKLVQEGIAHNLVSIKALRQCGDSIDYECVYNRVE